MTKYNMITGGEKKKKTIVKLKLVVEMLQKTVLPGSKKLTSPQRNNEAAGHCYFDDDEDDHDVEMSTADNSVGGGGRGGGVPADVKEGHFAVIASTEEGEVKRFVVPLMYLEYPPFMQLLKEAEEEYGFDNHDGALTLPCHPRELERILSSSSQQQKNRRRRASGSFMLNKMTNWVALST